MKDVGFISWRQLIPRRIHSAPAISSGGGQNCALVFVLLLLTLDLRGSQDNNQMKWQNRNLDFDGQDKTKIRRKKKPSARILLFFFNEGLVPGIAIKALPLNVKK